MADDTRDPDNDQPPRPKGPANTMPGGMAHTAGGKVDQGDLTYFQAISRLGPEYYLNFYKRPCVRDSQLNGIAAGFISGSIAAIIGRPVKVATNYGVGAWCVVSCLSYQYCQYWRSKEKDGVKQMKELMEKKRASIEAKKEARRKAKEEYERIEEERRKEEERRRSWSFWISKNAKFWER